MIDRELMKRVQAIVAELDVLIPIAERNSKYYTLTRLTRSRRDLHDAAGSLSFHVEEQADAD